MGRECSQDFVFLALGHLDEVEGAPQLGRNFIEFIGRDPKFAMSFLQAERSAPGSCGCKLEGSTRNVADPQGAHEFQARQPAQVVRVPLTEGRIRGTLTDDRILDDGIAEVVDDCRDRECATEPFVQR